MKLKTYEAIITSIFSISFFAMPITITLFILGFSYGANLFFVCLTWFFWAVILNEAIEVYKKKGVNKDDIDTNN